MTDGPFTESKEIIGGWAILQADSKEEVLRVAREFMELHLKHWPGFEGESEVRPMFEQRVLAVSEDVIFKWRLLVEQGRKAGHTFSQPDLIIAATALHHDLTVVSPDTSDYEKARVPFINPWNASKGPSFT